MDQETTLFFLLDARRERGGHRLVGVVHCTGPVARTQVQLSEPEQHTEPCGLVACRLHALQLGLKERAGAIGVVGVHPDDTQLEAGSEVGRETREMVLQVQRPPHVILAIATPEDGLCVTQLAERDRDLELVARPVGARG